MDFAHDGGGGLHWELAWILEVQKMVWIWILEMQKWFKLFKALRLTNLQMMIINKPGVSSAVLQTPLLLTDSFILLSLSSKPSKHSYTQTVRATELIFWDNVHPPPFVTRQVSGVRCQVSGVSCQVSGVTCIFFYKVVELVGGGSVINGAYPV